MRDEVAALGVEGADKSSIVRQIARNSVDRCVERAAALCRKFNPNNERIV
jgi:hypothetical protein